MLGATNVLVLIYPPFFVIVYFPFFAMMNYVLTFRMPPHLFKQYPNVAYSDDGQPNLS
jgi:hypothetical protein